MQNMLPLSTLDIESLALLSKYYRRKLDCPDALTPTQILEYGDIAFMVNSELRERNQNPAKINHSPRRKKKRERFKSLDSNCPGQTIGEVYPADPREYTQRLLLK